MHRATGKLTSCEDGSAAWFDPPEDSFLIGEFISKRFYPPAKASCHPAGNINDISGLQV